MTKKFGFKRLLCLLLALAMLMSLSACGLGSAITAAKVARAMSKLESVSGDMELELELSAYSLKIPATLSAPVDFIISPFALHADTQIEISGQSVPVLKIYAEKADKKLNLYLGATANSLLGSKEVWTASQSTLKDSPKFGVKTILAIYSALVDSFSEAGTEKLGRYNTVRYEGVLPEALVEKFFEGSGGMTVSDVKFSESELIDAFSDTPVSFWLDSDTHCIVKLEMDLSRSADILFLGILSQALGTELDAGIDKAVMSFTVSSFDTVDEIVIPQEAKDALEEALSKK